MPYDTGAVPQINFINLLKQTRMKKLKWMAAGTLLAGSMLLGSCQSEIPETPETNPVTNEVPATATSGESAQQEDPAANSGVGVILNK